MTFQKCFGHVKCSLLLKVSLMNGKDENASGDFHYVKSMGPVGPMWLGQGLTYFLPLEKYGSSRTHVGGTV